MSGRYLFHFGVYSNQDINSNGVPTNFTFIPAILKKEAGYKTHMVGKASVERHEFLSNLCH